MKIKIQILQNEIFFTYTEKQFRKLQKKFKKEGLQLQDMNGKGMAQEWRHKDGQLFYVLAITKKKDLGLLAHEASHIVTYMMETYGFTDDEFRSYMLATIIYEAQNIMRRCKE